MTEKEIKDLMGKYLKGTITKREEALLERFDSELLSKNLHEFSGSAPFPRAPRFPPASKKRNNSLKWMAIAATLALIFSLGHLLSKQGDEGITVPQPNQREGITQWGQKLNIRLGDGTQVRLNSGSSLKYPESFIGDKREVELTGEAFFEVSPDSRPFVIRSGEVMTTVLGTSFNINTYSENEQVAVTVASGKVRVASPNKEIHLGPNEQGLYDKRTRSMAKKVTDIAPYLNWKDGILSFEDADMISVAGTLERWYGAKINFGNKGIGRCHITATYDNVDLEAILESIVYAKQGLRYEFLGETEVLIEGYCRD